MLERNTVVGLDFLIVGLALAALGYILALSIPIAAFGLAVSIIGALLILVVPEPVPQDAYKSLVKDAIRNVEIILEESSLKQRAYFMRLEDGELRALIPLTGPEGTKEIPAASLQELNRAPRRFVVSYKDVRGLMLIPPGSEIVRLAKVEKGGDLEESLRSVLVDYSDFAGSVIAAEEEGTMQARVQISKPRLTSDSPAFNNCLGSPVSCIAACVAAVVKDGPVRIVDEKYDPALVRLTLEVV